MPFDGVRFLANAQSELAHQRMVARETGQSAEEIARLEQLLTAVSIMLDARAYEHTFH